MEKISYDELKDQIISVLNKSQPTKETLDEIEEMIVDFEIYINVEYTPFWLKEILMEYKYYEKTDEEMMSIIQDSIKKKY